MSGRRSVTIRQVVEWRRAKWSHSDITLIEHALNLLPESRRTIELAAGGDRITAYVDKRRAFIIFPTSCEVHNTTRSLTGICDECAW